MLNAIANACNSGTTLNAEFADQLEEHIAALLKGGWGRRLP